MDSSGEDAFGGRAAAAASPTVPPLGPAAQETLCKNNGTAVSVTIVPQTAGRNTKRSLVWQVFSEFTPSINGKNVFCTVCRYCCFSVFLCRVLALVFALEEGGGGSQLESSVAFPLVVCSVD